MQNKGHPPPLFTPLVFVSFLRRQALFSALEMQGEEGGPVLETAITEIPFSPERYLPGWATFVCIHVSSFHKLPFSPLRTQTPVLLLSSGWYINFSHLVPLSVISFEAPVHASVIKIGFSFCPAHLSYVNFYSQTSHRI